MEYIPFITSEKALQLVKNVYIDADMVRVPLELIDKLSLPPRLKIWLDAGVDGFDDLAVRKPKPSQKDSKKEVSTLWYDGMKKVPGYEDLGDPLFAKKPTDKVTNNFVFTILDRCVAYKPTWITVPQLPIVSDASRNKINRALAKSTAKWKLSRQFSGRLILPVILTHPTQSHLKVDRNKVVAQVSRNYQECHADGYWVVDESFSDEHGSKNLRNARLTSLVQLHQELTDTVSSRIRIAGPYWGANLVLWARRLVDYPGIGIGGSYRFRLSGQHKGGSTPASRIALGPLRRRSVGPHIRGWLEKTLKKIDSHSLAYEEMELIQRKLTFLSEYDHAREQVARFYKRWLDIISATPASGRSLALFQDLSSAYTMGKSLSEIPNEGPTRRPESIAEPLMLNCL